MSALVLALASSLAWGAADFAGGLMSRRLPLLNVLVISQIAGLTGLAIAVAIQGDSAPSAHYALLAALSGLGGGLGLTAFYRALAIGNMAIVAPISATAAVIPLTIGLIGGDVLGGLQGLGIALALIGVIVASTNEVTPHGGRIARGAGLAVLSAVGFGTFLALIDAASDGGALWAVLISRVTSLTLFACAFLATRTSFEVDRRDVRILAAVGLLEASANVMFAIAATTGLISLVAVLGSLYPIATIALAFVVLHERPGRLAAVGVIATMVGVVLITAG